MLIAAQVSFGLYEKKYLVRPAGIPACQTNGET
jgi:hypothetical protein